MKEKLAVKDFVYLILGSIFLLIGIILLSILTEIPFLGFIFIILSIILNLIGIFKVSRKTIGNKSSDNYR